MRHQLSLGGDGDFVLPDEVKRGLEQLGWVEHDFAESRLKITDTGCAASDVAAPEYGVDPLAVCAAEEDEASEGEET